MSIKPIGDAIAAWWKRWGDIYKWVIGGILFILGFIASAGLNYAQLAIQVKNYQEAWDKDKIESVRERQGIQADLSQVKKELASSNERISRIEGKLDIVVERLK